jgi:S1-C subfamily serine protease
VRQSDIAGSGTRVKGRERSRGGRSRSHWARACGAAVSCALLLAGSVGVAQEQPPDPAKALAFIRVRGDVRTEFTRVFKPSIVHRDVEIATGTGFVIAPTGLVLTCNHVVNQDPAQRIVEGSEAVVTIEDPRIEVLLAGAGQAQSYEGWVVASDPESDLAALQVTAGGLAYLPFGDSDAAQPGGPVRVLGFPFGRQADVGRRAGAESAPAPSVTAGSLQAARADDAGDTRYLQTDASVMPGSSGGPMVDQDGYVVGVVSMKLASSPRSRGAGFGVPINLVKDFLEANGLAGQLPVSRLRPGVVNTLPWKGLRVELPDGFQDTSLARLRVDAGDSPDGISFRVLRLAASGSREAVEGALLDGRTVPAFAPGAVSVKLRLEQGQRVLGWGRGRTADGRAFRIEYALVFLEGEAVAARYLGPPDAVAFNLGLLQRSLQSLEADPLLTQPVRAPLAPAFEPAPLPGTAEGRVPMPAGWSFEPSPLAACEAIPRSDAGLAASPTGDFTVVFRTLRWPRTGIDAPAVARACGGESEARGSTYAMRLDRLGVPTIVWGVLASHGEETLLLEAEVPEEKLAFVKDAFTAWVQRATE